VASASGAARTRRWPWVLLVVVVLAVGLVVAAEAVARAVVPGVVRDKVVSALALPADQQLDVELGGGLVVPQLLAGSLDVLGISGSEVPIGDLTVDADVQLTGVPIRDGGDSGPGTAQLRLDAADLQALVEAADVPPVLADAQIALSEPDVLLSKEFTILGASVPVEIGLTPAAADGDLTLTPSRAKLGGTALSIDQLAAMLRGEVPAFPICFADHIPAGLTLTSAVVAGDHLAADIDIAEGLLSDPALQAMGTCG